MECLPVEKIPEGDVWTYELKLDGYRAIAVKKQRESEGLLTPRYSLDLRFEDFASLRESPLCQILATPDEHIERIQHDVGLGGAAILQQIEVQLSQLVKSHNFAVDHRLIGQARQGIGYISESVRQVSR